MGRPQKIELDYFPLVCGFFQDQRIIELRREHGALGIATYIFLLTQVYSKGYYLKIQSVDSFAQTIAENIASSREPTAKVATHVVSAMRYLADIGLIDKYYLAQNCITGVRIQKQYAKSKERYGGQALIKEFSLLGEDNAFELVLEEKTAVSATETSVSVTETPVKATEMPQSKVNKSKEKESNVVGLSDEDYNDLVTQIGKDNCDFYIERVKAFREKIPTAKFDVKTTILKWYRQDKAKDAKNAKSNEFVSRDGYGEFGTLNDEEI